MTSYTTHTMETMQQPTKDRIFTRYQVFIITIIALIQFSVILDFMVLSPLGEILLKKLNIQTREFGLVVSVYAISAGTSGIIAAGFADKFDRKKMLLVFYTGFIFGTFLCAIAPSYIFLLGARFVTGLFGGVIGATGMAIIADLFKPEVRGRVMGFTQMAFSLSQIVGVPVGWKLANTISWHAPFWLIVIYGLVLGVIILVYMKPITGHLTRNVEHSAIRHLKTTLTNRRYFFAFGTTVLLATGGYMLMPFGSTFSRHNMGLSQDDIFWLYVIIGIVSFILGPLLGKLTDKLGRVRVFYAATLLTAVMVVISTHLHITPLYIAAIINSIMFVGVLGRMIPAQAIMTSIPSPQDRGAFMSISGSVQQLAGGIGSFVAGLIVYQTSSGMLLHYDILGFVIVGAMLITVFMMYLLNKQLTTTQQAPPTLQTEDVAMAS